MQGKLLSETGASLSIGLGDDDKRVQPECHGPQLTRRYTISATSARRLFLADPERHRRGTAVSAHRLALGA